MPARRPSSVPYSLGEACNIQAVARGERKGEGNYAPLSSHYLRLVCAMDAPILPHAPGPQNSDVDLSVIESLLVLRSFRQLCCFSSLIAFAAI